MLFEEHNEVAVAIVSEPTVCESHGCPQPD